MGNLKSFALLEPEAARFDLFEDSQQPYNAGAWGARRDVRRRIAWRAPKTRLRRSSASLFRNTHQKFPTSSRKVEIAIVREKSLPKVVKTFPNGGSKTGLVWILWGLFANFLLVFENMHILETFGNVWKLLRTFAKFRELLQTFTKFCELLRTFGDFW